MVVVIHGGRQDGKCLDARCVLGGVGASAAGGEAGASPNCIVQAAPWWRLLRAVGLAKPGLDVEGLLDEV